jgi:hypothetical protein
MQLCPEPDGTEPSLVAQHGPAAAAARAVAMAMASEGVAHGMSSTDILAEVVAFLTSWAHHPSHTLIGQPSQLHLVLDTERAEQLGTA